MCFKYKIGIKPNTIGPGLSIYHLGSLIRTKNNYLIGLNLWGLPEVVIGNKNLSDDGSVVTIGDNCVVGGVSAKRIKQKG